MNYNTDQLAHFVDIMSQLDNEGFKRDSSLEEVNKTLAGLYIQNERVGDDCPFETMEHCQRDWDTYQLLAILLSDRLKGKDHTSRLAKEWLGPEMEAAAWKQAEGKLYLHRGIVTMQSEAAFFIRGYYVVRNGVVYKIEGEGKEVASGDAIGVLVTDCVCLGDYSPDKIENVDVKGIISLKKLESPSNLKRVIR